MINNFLLKDKNFVIQDIINKFKCGLVYENLSELKISDEIEFVPYVPTFEKFLETIIKANNEI